MRLTVNTSIAFNQHDCSLAKYCYPALYTYNSLWFVLLFVDCVPIFIFLVDFFDLSGIPPVLWLYTYLYTFLSRLTLLICNGFIYNVSLYYNKIATIFIVRLPPAYCLWIWWQFFFDKAYVNNSIWMIKCVQWKEMFLIGKSEHDCKICLIWS